MIDGTQPIEHNCRNGTTVTCQANLQGTIRVVTECSDRTVLATDIAEFIGWHATCIYPELNGFQGYDCLTIVVRP